MPTTFDTAGVYPTIDKDPDAVLDYDADWTTWLGTDTILTSSWTITPTGQLAVQSDSINAAAKITKVWLSGGAAGSTYLVRNRITTVVGRTEDRSFNIRGVQR